MEWTTILGYVFSALTGIVGWIVGKRKRNNDFIADLQHSISLLTDENNKLLNELVTVKKQNVELLTNQERMTLQMEALKEENQTLKNQIDKITDKLSNVKTITKTCK